MLATRISIDIFVFPKGKCPYWYLWMSWQYSWCLNWEFGLRLHEHLGIIYFSSISHVNNFRWLFYDLKRGHGALVHPKWTWRQPMSKCNDDMCIVVTVVTVRGSRESTTVHNVDNTGYATLQAGEWSNRPHATSGCCTSHVRQLARTFSRTNDTGDAHAWLRIRVDRIARRTQHQRATVSLVWCVECVGRYEGHGKQDGGTQIWGATCSIWRNGRLGLNWIPIEYEFEKRKRTKQHQPK